jgi:hypothetical protein
MDSLLMEVIHKWYLLQISAFKIAAFKFLW